MLKLEARPQPSNFWSYGSPLLALLVTVVIGVILFAALGKDPIRGLEMFFWQPIRNAYALGLADRHVLVDLLAVEIHRHHRLLHALAIRKARGAEHDVVGVPFADAVVGVIGRFGFVNDRAHAVRRLVAVEHLDLVTVLEIHAAVLWKHSPRRAVDCSEQH